MTPERRSNDHDFEIRNEDMESCVNANRTLRHPKFQQLLDVVNRAFDQRYTVEMIVEDIAAREQFQDELDQLRIKYSTVFGERGRLFEVHADLVSALYRRDVMLRDGDDDDDPNSVLVMPYAELPPME